MFTLRAVNLPLLPITQPLNGPSPNLSSSLYDYANSPASGMETRMSVGAILV